MKHVLLQGTALLCAVFLPGCVRSSALVHQAGLGPRIEIVQPKGDLVENSPFAIQIEFVPQTGSQIDVNRHEPDHASRFVRASHFSGFGKEAAQMILGQRSDN